MTNLVTSPTTNTAKSLNSSISNSSKTIGTVNNDTRDSNKDDNKGKLDSDKSSDERNTTDKDSIDNDTDVNNFFNSRTSGEVMVSKVGSRETLLRLLFCLQLRFFADTEDRT